MALLRVWGIVRVMSWPELFIENWETVHGTMRQLGIKGGHQRKGEVDANPVRGGELELLAEKGRFLQHWAKDGLQGVHLIWDFKEDGVDDLLEMMSVDSLYYEGLSGSERKEIEGTFVVGQQRKVAVVCPVASASAFWVMLSKAHGMADDACDLHYMARFQNTNLLSTQFGKMFGGLFSSVSVRPNGKTITMPNGGDCQTDVAFERKGLSDWLELVGFDLESVTLSGPLGVRNRRALSITSALWASRNWDDSSRLEKPPDDPEWSALVATVGASPAVLDEVPIATSAIRKKRGASPEVSLGDMIACNSCSLFDRCRLARAGAICTLPESDMGELASFFKTRDAQQVIDGLGLLLAKQADRVEAAMAAEDVAGADEAETLRSDVTKMIHGLFDRGAKLAQLNDPRLKGGPAVQVSLTQNAVGQIGAGSPQQLAAGVVAELESRGVQRKDITPELIASTLGMDDDVTEAVVVPKDPVVGIIPEGR